LESARVKDPALEVALATATQPRDCIIQVHNRALGTGGIFKATSSLAIGEGSSHDIKSSVELAQTDAAVFVGVYCAISVDEGCIKASWLDND
jgi:hypothetical protein